VSVRGAQETISSMVKTWEGVEYATGKREIGHIHGDNLVDIPFPKKIRDEIVQAGDALPHHILPETGWVSFYLRDAGDVQKAIALLEKSYQIARKQKIKVEQET